MLYFSSLLKTIPEYAASAGNLFTALSKCGEEYIFFDGAKDIWAKLYAGQTGSRKYISFRYEPCYLKDDPQLKTDFKNDVAPKLSLLYTEHQSDKREYCVFSVKRKGDHFRQGVLRKSGIRKIPAYIRAGKPD